MLSWHTEYNTLKNRKKNDVCLLCMNYKSVRKKRSIRMRWYSMTWMFNHRRLCQIGLFLISLFFSFCLSRSILIRQAFSHLMRFIPRFCFTSFFEKHSNENNIAELFCVWSIKIIIFIQIVNLIIFTTENLLSNIMITITFCEVKFRNTFHSFCHFLLIKICSTSRHYCHNNCVACQISSQTSMIYRILICK